MAVTSNTVPESDELIAAQDRYTTAHRWLRWCTWLTGVSYILGALMIAMVVYQDSIAKPVMIWFFTPRKIIGIDITPVVAFGFFMGIVCFIAGCCTAYYAYRARYIRREYYHLSRLPREVAYIATPKGIVDQPSDLDALGFDTLVGAISGLLRNPFTQSPYSLVLSGGWGSGKSSLMAQIRRTLTATDSRPAFQSLWFNVWHYQTEQHLLTSFLGAILASCEELPGFYQRLWWRRLISQGFWESLRTAFVFALLLPIISGLLYALLYTALGRGADSANQSMAHAFHSVFGKSDKTALLALVATWTGAAYSLLKSWQERSNLLAGLMPLERFRLEAAHADAGFRRKYQQEFRQIMQATPPDTQFLIFIDDVDRVPGGRVLELLESINFISDTASQSKEERDLEAKLYFILGMYVPEVARTLGEALDPKSRLDEVNATRHAARYLAKLVDLVVPLPGLQNCTSEQLSSLLFGGTPQVIANTSKPSNAFSTVAEEKP